MSRTTLCLVAAFCLSLASGAAAQVATDANSLATLAEKQALELASLRVRYAQAIQALSEAELQAALEANYFWPGRVSSVQLQRLRAMLDASRMSVRVAESLRSPQETKKAMLRLTLAQRVSARFEETPLIDFAAAIREKYRVNVVLDQKALDNAGLGTDTPITVHLQDATLQTTLTRALKPFDLTFLIDDELILITTIDEASQRLETTIYDVYDLLAWNSLERQEIPGERDYEAIIMFITSTIAPTTWDDVGGPGAITPLMGMLVISQTQEVHAQISDVLLSLRKTRLGRSDRTGLMRLLEAGQ